MSYVVSGEPKTTLMGSSPTNLGSQPQFATTRWDSLTFERQSGGAKVLVCKQGRVRSVAILA